MQAKQCCVGLCKPNKLYTVRNIMLLPNMIFSHHFNNIPVVTSLMGLISSHMDGGNSIFSTRTDQRCLCLGSLCSRESLYKTRIIAIMCTFVLVT